jgi:Flp pilus assembly protein TadB
MPHLSPDAWYFVARYMLLLFAFATLAFAFAFWRGAARRDARRMYEQLESVAGGLQRIAESLQAHETRTDSQFAELTRVISEESRTATAAGAHAHRLYETAIRLARTGVSREDLIANCGVMAHEADLVILLHGPRPASEGAGSGRQTQSLASA